MRGWRQILAVAILCLMGVATIGGSADAQLLGDRSGDRSQENSVGASWLPGPLKAAIAWTARQQATFNRSIEREVRAYRQDGSLAGATVLIGLAFLYGIFHAVGPGHGKAVVTSYFLAREAAIWRGLILGGAIAMIQAISAIAIVGGLGWLLEGRRLAILDSMTAVEAVSYGLVVLLGIYMTWASVTGRDCGHDHSGLGHDPDHDHPHGHGHRVPADRASRVEIAGAALVSGMRPCTGALIVLFFTLANGILAIGVLATVAMAVGVAITVSSIGILAILARRGLLRLSPAAMDGGHSGGILARGLSFLGSVFVLGIGIVLLAGVLQRGGLLT